MTDATPSVTPRTSPDPSTVATDESLDDQVNAAPSTRCSLWSNASATSRSVSPTETVSAGGDTTTELGDWITVITASPDAAPAVAVIVVVPIPSAVTSPLALTAATAAWLLAQVTLAPAIA